MALRLTLLVCSAAFVVFACSESSNFEEPEPAFTKPQFLPKTASDSAKPRSTFPTNSTEKAPDVVEEVGEENHASVPRIGALVKDTYIREKPDLRSSEIGSLDLGGMTALKSTESVSQSGCSGGWYAVLPQGFVCHNENTTLEPEQHPLIVAKGEHAAKLQEDNPYRWGESRYVPSYRKIPEEKEQRKWEGHDLEKHLAALEKLRDARRAGASEAEVRTPGRLRGVDIFPAKGVPPAFLSEGSLSPWAVVHTPSDTRARYQMIPSRSTIAWTDEFFAEGRSWLLTPELFLVPKDKISLQQPSDFKGVQLGEGGEVLPIVFIRGGPKNKYKIEGEEDSSRKGVVKASWVAGVSFEEDPGDSKGSFVPTGESWDRLAWVGLTGRARWQRGKRYLETKEEGLWIREEDAVVVAGRDPGGLELKEGEKWIDVSIYRGLLVAYEGRRPVFATLISPGLRGYARENGKPTKNTTPTGAYRIEWKHWTRTMSPDPEKKTYYLSEVPFTQFFHVPFALHGVYWHDDFGEPKSGGCVNLSVADARWLFGWTEPSVPEGWHAVRSGQGRGDGTWVVIR